MRKLTPRIKKAVSKRRPAVKRAVKKAVLKAKPVVKKGRPSAGKTKVAAVPKGRGMKAATKALVGGAMGKIAKAKPKGRPNLGGPGGYKKGSIGAKRTRMARKK